MIIINDAMIVGVLPGQNRCATGRAKGRRHVGVRQHRAISSHRVDVRCFQERMTRRAETIEAVIVTQDEQNIGMLRGCSLRLDKRRTENQQQRQEQTHKRIHDRYRGQAIEWVFQTIT